MWNYEQLLSPNEPILCVEQDVKLTNSTVGESFENCVTKCRSTQFYGNCQLQQPIWWILDTASSCQLTTFRSPSPSLTDCRTGSGISEKERFTVLRLWDSESWDATRKARVRCQNCTICRQNYDFAYFFTQNRKGTSTWAIWMSEYFVFIYE